MMKRIRKAIVKTTVLGRNGKSTVQTPLNVTASCSKVSSHGSARVDSFENLEPDNHLEDQFDIDVAAIGDESASMKRNISNFCNWEKVRVSLINASLEEAYMPDNSLCSVCLDQQASIRCQYCGPRQFFCQPCGYKLHENRNQFHVMEQWTENKYVPLFPNHGVIDNGHQCDSKILRLFKLVDAFGNQHLKQVAVCECESHAATLIRAQFWPGSPEKPSIGFHFKLMDLAETLFLHNQVPLKDFSELLLELVPSMQPILIATMYRTLNSGCFDEYRYYKYKLKYLDFFVPSLYNGADCPLCPVENGTVIECIDACFGLIRRKGKGGKSISSRHGSLLFSDQDDVDNFVDNYQHKGPKAVSQDCSRFHAGEVVPALRSKGKNQLFDEKGVFGRVCRHDFPKSFLNIKHGERISYSVYELEKIKESITSKNVKVVLMYDIACILSSHLKGSGREDLLTDVNLAVPIFHCYGHKALCQVKYSPRRTPNVGLTDGEGVERLWSFMRQFSKITKEMSVDKRVDVLTDAAIHYGQHLFARFGTTLKVKYTRTTTLASTVEVEIKSLLLKLPNNVDDATIQQWIVNEISEMTPKQNDLEYQWDELYTELLITARKLRSELIYAQEEEPDRVGILQSKIKRNEKAMGNIEKEHGVRVRWKKGEPSFENAKRRLVEKKRLSLLLVLHRIASERIFLLELKAKYAEGQALAIKLANQINRVVTEMNKSLAALNGLTNDESVVFDDIKDPQGDIYRTLTVPNNDGVVPNKIKKRIIELVCLQDRCREELIMVKEEMLVFCNFLRGQINTMSSYVRDNHSSNPQKAGLQCLLLQKVLMYQKHLQSLQIMWGNIVTFQFTETNESTFLLTKPSEITSFLPHDCDCCDDSTNL